MTKPRLLLVDDDKNSLDGLMKILRHDGFSVSGVLSAYDALNLISRENFDIVLTDMKMPGMGGLSLIHEVRKKELSVAIVVITAYSSEKAAAEAEKYGANYYLKKPVNIEELECIIGKLWEKQQLIARNPAAKGNLNKTHNSPAMNKNRKVIRQSDKEGEHDIHEFV
ncbi:MAG: hypothetical protein DCC43_06535 [Candidatus Brocadia sp.]|jgi:DNA-binding NtrC family response regulator|uniref:Two-component response regulator n=1 Tax=Candidatus Brocadia fulgida TaxID=380242 RepID=A0A0M2UZE9_9BACT|nr:MAG: two-component response regulator [Candidatus Brocadia fulgida]MCC6326460.1 response regulator [Candidatus Brocadia sp.]MCE7911619.1 response regulator [Candidatus Brocadia sp. AMX3]OQY97313.1 MAG: hypothetical protein B6D35_15540 [Candidatus Brocadia sp. UTAMX2]MBV6519688.1 Sensor histidine kinase RcsC [Candidatus Brocadia fulgida]